MPIITITREMGSLGKDVARALGAELKVPVVYHEVIDHLADRMRVASRRGAPAPLPLEVR